MQGPAQAPNIRHVVIIRQHERSLEAAQREVILPRIEAAKTHVVPELLREKYVRKTERRNINDPSPDLLTMLPTVVIDIYYIYNIYRCPIC